MEIRIKGNQIRFIHNDNLVGLMEQGKTEIRRASHVEPDENGQWKADLSPVSGPALGPFALRREALEAEVNWLLANKIPIPIKEQLNA